MSRWITVSRRDPEFTAYLDGSFSRTHRALPVRSLNVDTNSEEVTFEIVPISEIQRPPLIKVALQAVRASSLLLSAGPMLATFFYALSRGYEYSPLITFSSFFGVLAFHMSVNLFNDYGDHMKGRDRVRPRGGSRVIQNGWVAAITLRRAAWTLMTIAALFGVPAIFLSTSTIHPVAVIAVLAGLVGLEFAFQKFRLKYRGFAELLAFALTGPLLCLGFGWAMTGQLVPDFALLGCIYGAISLMYFHSVNFENIMTDSQAGVSTWATRAGFDSSKSFFYFTAALTVTFALTFAVFFGRDMAWVIALLAIGAMTYPLIEKVRSVASPLSSALSRLRLNVIWFSCSTTLILIGTFIAMAVRGVA